MKNLTITLFVLAALGFFNLAQAQQTLIDRFGADAIASIQGTEKLEILTYQNMHGYAVQDLSGQKDVSNLPDALEVAPLSSDTPPLSAAVLEEGFELFAYDFPASPAVNQYYRIGDTGKLLVVYATAVVKRHYNLNNNPGE